MKGHKINIVLEKKPQTTSLPVFRQVDEHFHHLVGMHYIKELVREIYAWLYVKKKRESLGLKENKQMLHMLLKGNPGTGKTTVARIIGQLMKELGVLTKGHLLEVERGDLVGEYIGHTAQKTRDVIKRAAGGILFVDEAYSLGRGGEKDFGKEAIDTLVKHTEDKAGDFVLMMAGYPKEMENFLGLNPGLPSRFPFILDFPDYTIGELLEIGQRMYAEREYYLTKEAILVLEGRLQREKYARRTQHFSNGRCVRNLVEKSIRKQAMRLLTTGTFDKRSLVTIASSDME